MKPFIHPNAIVEEGAILNEGVKVWHFCHVRTGAQLGKNVSVGKGSYIDAGVQVGEGTRIQNDVNVYQGVQIESYCFVGPAVVFTNDQTPRVGNKTWKVVDTHIDVGAAIGAGAVVRCGIRIGAFSMIAAGAVVTKSVPPFHLALGVPAEGRRKVCACGQTNLDLSAGYSELLRDCCKENMSETTLALAKAELKKLMEA